MKCEALNIGDERIRIFFAIFPITARNKSGRWEIRWLEKVTIKQSLMPSGWYTDKFIY